MLNNDISLRKELYATSYEKTIHREDLDRRWSLKHYTDDHKRQAML